MSLLLDAFKHTRKHGMIRLLASYDEKSQLLVIHVAQTGEGLKSEDCVKINRLMRSDLVTPNDLQASDVDNVLDARLLACTSLVKVGGGRIQIQSQGLKDGRVITISLELPRARSPSKEPFKLIDTCSS